MTRNEPIFHIQSSGVKLIYNILHNIEKTMKTVLRQWGNLRQERSYSASEMFLSLEYLVPNDDFHVVINVSF